MLTPAASAQSRTIGTVVIANGWSSADSAVAASLAALKSTDTSDAVALYSETSSLTSFTETRIRQQQPSGKGLAITQYYVAYRACTATDGDTTVLTCCINPTSRDTWGNWVELSHGAATTAATITGLTNGTKYEVRVRARTANGAGPWSPVASETPLAAPLTPTGLTVEPSNTQMVVSWTEPAAHGPTITGYIVQYRDCTATRKDCTSSPKWNPTWTTESDEGTGASRTITGLTNDTAYQVQVRAKSGTGSSGRTPIKWAIVAAVPDAPGVPTLEHRNRQIDVEWTEPTDHNSTIEHYQVGYRPCTGTNSDATVLTCASKPAWGSWRLHGDDGPSLSRIITGLTNGTAYQVRVRAQNEKGWGPWSPSAKATPASSPAALTAPTVTTGDGQLTVDWIVPRSNGSAISGYDVRYRNCIKTNSDAAVLTCASNPELGPWTDQDVLGKDNTTYTIAGRTNGTAVQVRIRADSEQGESPWSSPVIGMPRGKPDAPVMTVTSGNRRLVVTWPAPNAKGSTVTGFKLRWCDDTASGTDCSSNYDDWTTRSLGSSTRTSTISGLTNGNSHKLEMLTTSRSHGDSVWTTESAATPGAPNAPSTPSLTAGPNSEEITVTWSLPAKNHSDITQYQVAYCNNTDGGCASGTWTAQNKSTGLADRRLTLASLTSGKSYKVRVRAENTQGWGAWSSTRTATPKA